MAVRQTCCRFCGLDIEAFSPYRRGTWRDHGNSARCPDESGTLHAPVPFGARRKLAERPELGRSLWHWRIDTANFAFDTYGRTRRDAWLTMRIAWTRHRRRTGAAMVWAEVSDGPGPQQRAFNTPYRDGMALS
jgi:hypothetical protein